MVGQLPHRSQFSVQPGKPSDYGSTIANLLFLFKQPGMLGSARDTDRCRSTRVGGCL